MLDLKKEALRRKAQAQLLQSKIQPVVCTEKRREDYPHLQEGMKVNTPVGLATITSIVQCPIMKRPRCSVQTAEKQPDGSHFRAFHLSEVVNALKDRTKILGSGP